MEELPGNQTWFLKGGQISGSMVVRANIYHVPTMGQVVFWALYVFTHLVFTTIVGGRYYDFLFTHEQPKPREVVTRPLSGKDRI